MARGGRSTSRSPPPRSSATTTKPAQTQQSPLAQTPAQSGGMMSGIGSTIAQGFAFGAGSAVAHQVVGSMFGGSSHKEQGQQQQQQQPQQTQQNVNPCQQ